MCVKYIMMNYNNLPKEMLFEIAINVHKLEPTEITCISLCISSRLTQSFLPFFWQNIYMARKRYHLICFGSVNYQLKAHTSHILATLNKYSNDIDLSCPITTIWKIKHESYWFQSDYMYWTLIKMHSN